MQSNRSWHPLWWGIHQLLSRTVRRSQHRGPHISLLQMGAPANLLHTHTRSTPKDVEDSTMCVSES